MIDVEVAFEPDTSTEIFHDGLVVDGGQGTQQQIAFDLLLAEFAPEFGFSLFVVDIG